MHKIIALAIFARQNNHSNAMETNNLNEQKTDSENIAPNFEPENFNQQPTDKEPENQGENPQEKEPLKGWLLFFLIVYVGIGSAVSLALNIKDYSNDGNFWTSTIDLAFATMYLVTGIFTIVAFVKRQSDAVYLAKLYIIMCFCSNLIALIVQDDLSVTQREFRSMARSLGWSLIWFIYMYRSHQINELFPLENRKIKTRSIIITVAAFLIPALFTVMSIYTDKSTDEIEQEAIENLVLEDYQLTDGRIVITLPDSTVCEESIGENGIKFFNITDTTTEVEATIVSAYDDDASQESFNEYFKGWKDEDFNKYFSKTLDSWEDDEDGVKTYYKLTRLTVDGSPVDWEFYVFFDTDKGRVCIISSYSSAYAESLARKLRFHFL